MAAGWLGCICIHSGTKTFGQHPSVKTGSEEAIFAFQKNYPGQTEIFRGNITNWTAQAWKR